MSDIAQLMRAANPVPDEAVALPDDEFDALLLLTQIRSGNMDVEELQIPVEPKRKRDRGWLVAAAAFVVVVVVVGVAVLLATGGGDDAAPAAPVEDAVSITPAAGPITFKTTVDLGESPVLGTFFVSAGADVLGCTGGTVVSMSVSETSMKNVMTCESGSNAGTFTIRYGTDLFKWSVLESSGDFAGLQGEGRFDFVMTSTSTVVETFTGDIEYTP